MKKEITTKLCVELVQISKDSCTFKRIRYRNGKITHEGTVRLEVGDLLELRMHSKIEHNE